MSSPAVDPAAWTCPLPLRDYPQVVMGHGGGGKLSSELVEHLFLPCFDDEALAGLGDSAVLPIEGGRLALTTDSFVVRPLFFPGGCIGDLAVHGTVNDLAMVGAQPLFLTAGFIVEEGMPVDDLGRIARAMGNAARRAGVRIVAGDTKVVDRGHGDGVYINTTGVGLVPGGVTIGPGRARPGDAVLVSGSVGNHGLAIMSVREGLVFETELESDSAALHGLVRELLVVCPDLRCLRDPTRGGVAASLNEIARASSVAIEIEERLVPVDQSVASACELLGLDPLYAANEGKLLAVVPRDTVTAVLDRMRAHPLAAGAVTIGRVLEGPPGRVTARTRLGGTRIVDTAIGEQLPRIC